MDLFKVELNNEYQKFDFLESLGYYMFLCSLVRRHVWHI